ncbi:MAG TPA: glycosyltransferase family 4 protein [Actinomycetaceae bacterium]|nr:glycosyltransferase family 4 protein [Actinomycetaceae bacterium]
MTEADITSAGATRTVVLIVTLEITAVNFYTGYVRYLTERGWNVVVIARSAGRLEQWAAGEGATAASIDFARRPAPWPDLKALAATTRLLRHLRPDAVISATPKAGLLGTLSARLAGVPVRIYQLWGLRLETESGLKRTALALTERLAMNSATQCVANSRSLAAAAERLGLAPEGGVTVLGAGSSHGVDVERFSPDGEYSLDEAANRFLTESDAELRLVYVGRLTPDKGIECMLDALEICERRGHRVAALVVGYPDSAAIMARIERADQARVLLVGPVRDVRPYLKAAGVLCLPTLREGFPNVVLEAAAMGIPAVVSDATGAIDSVVDGVTGKVFPVNDAGRLASALIEFAETPALLRSLGRAARERVEREFRQSHVWRLQADNLEKQAALAHSPAEKGQTPAESGS